MEHLNFQGVEDMENWDFMPDEGVEDFDYFFGKKYKARKEAQKAYEEQGFSKSEAKALALNDVPPSKAGAFLRNLLSKAGNKVSELDTAEVQQDQANAERDLAIIDTDTGDYTQAGMGLGDMGGAGFYDKNKTAIMLVGGLAIVGVLGFAFRKQLGF